MPDFIVASLLFCGLVLGDYWLFAWVSGAGTRHVLRGIYHAILAFLRAATWVDTQPLLKLGIFLSLFILPSSVIYRLLAEDLNSVVFWVSLVSFFAASHPLRVLIEAEAFVSLRKEGKRR